MNIETKGSRNLLGHWASTLWFGSRLVTMLVCNVLEPQHWGLLAQLDGDPAFNTNGRS